MVRVVVYEYLPCELARAGVIAQAAGLDRHQVSVQVRLAQERVGRARLRPTEPHHLSELFIADLRRLQWERIAQLMERAGGRVRALSGLACSPL